MTEAVIEIPWRNFFEGTEVLWLRNKAEIASRNGEIRSGRRMYLAEFSLWSEMYVSEAIVKALPRALPINSVAA